MTQHACTVDPFGSGKPNHSDDLMEIYHGHDEPMFACGYHWTYWPNLVFAQKGR